MEESHKLEMEKSVIEMGFDSINEYNRLISSIDLSNQFSIQRYQRWLEYDGTKKGLIDKRLISID